MEQYRQLAKRLRSLAVFRSLLEDPVIKGLIALLEADSESVPERWAALAAALYQADQEQVDLVRTAYEYQFMLNSVNNDLKRLQSAAKAF